MAQVFRFKNKITMKIASFNVNSIKVRLEHVKKFLIEENIDVLLLQELKCIKENFPFNEIENLGFKVIVNGQKSYNGVAIISKFPIKLISNFLPNISNGKDDGQARFLDVKILDFRIICVYLPNGNPIETEKYEYKLNWLKRLTSYCKKLYQTNEKIIIGGDFNIIQKDIDCYDPKVWINDALFTDKVKNYLKEILNFGFVDAYRIIKPSSQEYSFWDYQNGAWQKDHGIRIDLFLLSPEVADLLDDTGIFKKIRGHSKPSDHVPIWLKLN